MEYYLYVEDQAGGIAWETEVTFKGFCSFFKNVYKPEDLRIEFENRHNNIVAVIYYKDTTYDIGYIVFNSMYAFLEFLKE